ncbi:MAG: hypothetical protein R6U50_05275 [Desulfobacterales bacterium]
MKTAARKIRPSQYTAAVAEKNISYLVDHQCPQCGAPAVLEETDRLFTCEYCRVASYLFPKDVFRYLLPNRAPADKEVFYFPYWRIKGMMFSCGSDGIQNRYVDVSHRAIAAHPFPASVGLRSQALKLSFPSDQNQARFLKPSLPLSRIMKRVQAPPGERVFHRTFIGETASLIYSPFYADPKLTDAVLNKPLEQAGTSGIEMVDDDSAREWKLQFLPVLCPACGWHLEGEKDAVVMLCKNCAAAWRPEKSGFQRIKSAYVPSSVDSAVYLPFWRIGADVDGIRLKSYEDLIHTANLPKVVRPGWNEKPFYFWTMALKIRPRKFLRSATHITTIQPREELIPGLPLQPLLSPNLPLKSVFNSLKLNLANFIRPAKVYFPKLPHITITPKTFLLVWLPFVDKTHELVHPDYRLSVLKSHLRTAGEL